MDLGCPRIVFPAAAGVASAIGLLVVEPRFDLARTTLLPLDDEDSIAGITDIYDEMEAEAALALQGEHYRIGEKLATRRVKATGEEPSAGGDGQHM